MTNECQIAAVLITEFLQRTASPLDPPALDRGQARHHAQQAGFASAVGARYAKERAGLYTKRLVSKQFAVAPGAG